jgi:ribosomal protein S27E
MQKVSTWRCKCGVRIKVVTEHDPKTPGDKIEVKCPSCGDKQMVYGSKVISLTKEM